MESALVALRRIIQIHAELQRENTRFLEGEPTPERLQPLLDQRETWFTELRELEAEIQTVVGVTVPGQPPMAFPEAVKVLAARHAEGAAESRRLRDGLQLLVTSEEAVQKAMASEKGRLSEQIKTLRKGSSLLKGYVQADPTGSCFIDKIR